MIADNEVGARYKSRNGLRGEIEEINRIKMLVVKNVRGKITQTISLRKIDLKQFSRDK